MRLTRPLLALLFAVSSVAFVAGCCAGSSRLSAIEAEFMGARAKFEFALVEGTAPPTCEPHCDEIEAKEGGDDGG